MRHSPTAPVEWVGAMTTIVDTHEPFLAVKQVAHELGISPATVRRRIEAGELPAVQLGGPGSAVRIPRAALDAWLWSNPDVRNYSCPEPRTPSPTRMRSSSPGRAARPTSTVCRTRL